MPTRAYLIISYSINFCTIGSGNDFTIASPTFIVSAKEENVLKKKE